MERITDRVKRQVEVGNLAGFAVSVCSDNCIDYGTLAVAAAGLRVDTRSRQRIAAAKRT